MQPNADSLRQSTGPSGRASFARLLLVREETGPGDPSGALEAQFAVSHVQTIDQAVELLEKAPELVLADVEVLSRDRYRLLDAIRANPCTAAIPVIVVAGSGSDAAVFAALEAGADDYLVAPFTEAELRLRVGTHLAKVRRRRGEARGPGASAGAAS